MKPGRYPIFLEQGVDWRRRMTWRSGPAKEVVPLAGYTARLTVRHPTEPGVYLVTLTDGEGITLSDESPNIIIEFTRDQIDALTITETTYRLDLTDLDGQSFSLLKDQLHVERW